MRPLRVLFITPLYIPWVGGMEILLRQLIAELLSRGHQATIVTAQGPGTSAGVDRVDDVAVHRLPVHDALIDRDAEALLHIQAELGRVVRVFAPDLAHAHDPGPMLWLYRRATRKRRLPLIVTLHNVMTHHFQGSFTTLAKLLDAADCVTGVSEAVLEDTLAYAPSVADRLSLIRNGTAPIVAAPTRNGGSQRLLCIGRLVPQKGFDLAIRAVAALVGGYPDLRLTIAGGGPEWPVLQELATELGVAEHIEFAGIVDRDRVAELLTECTMVVMPSRFEGLPLVAIEAGWAARPVIGTDAPGISEAVVHERTGLVARTDDSGALAAAIGRLLEDEALTEEMGRNARARVEAEHSLRACAEQYERLYGQVLEGRAVVGSSP